jgi:hypothetical protein
MKYIITCSPYPKNGSYITQFSMFAENKEHIINYCEKEGIYYKTIVSLKDCLKMNFYQKPLHEIEK